jgi:ribonuclease P/MRP protein subunit RPP40
MLDIGKSPNLPTPKCYFSTTNLASYNDSSELPTKKAPFNLLNRTPYYHTLTLVSPTSSPLNITSKPSKYARLHLPLLDLLQGDFFTKHIKTGNVLLLSLPLKLEATSSEASFTLIDGMLVITCDRALYERAGLTGTAIPDPHARKHGASKFRIELNLRLPSMLAGKKGFERILRAAETVFVGDISWLFYDVSAAGVADEDATLRKDSQIKHVEMVTENLEKVLVLNFPTQISKSADGEDDLVELLEWISLAAIGSPRVQQGDLVDEIISRYEVPSISKSSITDRTDQPSTRIRTQDLTKASFTGFMPCSFVSSIFGDAIMQLKESWFAVLVQGFEDGKAVVILKTEDNRVLSWDVEG